MIQKKLEELESLITVPNVDEESEQSINAMKMLNILVGLRSLVKNCNIPVVKVRYLLIEWINGNPVIDGCKHFDSKDDCLEYWQKMPKVIGVEYTICETNAP